MPDIDFAQVFIVFLVLLFSLTLHEAAHAWSADRLGDATARSLGRVSLNPAVHVDPIGTIAFPLIAMMTNVPILGWAKPVPVNVHQLRGDWKRKFMLIAAAGPASNLAIAVACSLILRVLQGAASEGGGLVGLVGWVLVIGVQINVLLAVFNMLPIPPLDGGNVVAGLLHGRAAQAFDGLRRYGFLILYALMFSGILWRIVSPPQRFLMTWLL